MAMPDDNPQTNPAPPPAEKKATKATYVLKDKVGPHYVNETDKDGNVTGSRRLKPGEAVQLTEKEAAAFGDKFEKKG
jgi:hypothetical protein